MPPPDDPLPVLASILPLLEQRGVTLRGGEQERIATLVDLLERWNRRINLTGARTRAQLLVRHVLDSLMVETLPWPAQAQEAVDVGSGAGLPGLLLALRHPQCRVTSVETVAKKIAFQTEAARTLGLANFVPLRRDVFALAREEGRHAFPLMVVRAFAELSVLLPLAADLLCPGGQLWAFKGAQAPREEAALTPELLAPFEPVRRHPYRFDAVDWGGVILVYRKR
jgi:16S rRNA (guanine527-N7)-methyltransferase